MGFFLYDWKCNNCGHVFIASNDANGCSKCGSNKIERMIIKSA